jgi:hypothetical protein
VQLAEILLARILYFLFEKLSKVDRNNFYIIYFLYFFLSSFVILINSGKTLEDREFLWWRKKYFSGHKQFCFVMVDGQDHLVVFKCLYAIIQGIADRNFHIKIQMKVTQKRTADTSSQQSMKGFPSGNILRRCDTKPAPFNLWITSSGSSKQSIPILSNNSLHCRELIGSIYIYI